MYLDRYVIAGAQAQAGETWLTKALFSGVSRELDEHLKK
jgi:hypothetical protein